MGERRPIHSDDAPAPVGPYSQGIRCGRLLFLSGQIPLDPRTGQLVTGEIDRQARQVFDNLQAVAASAGGCLQDAVKINISLTELENFAAVNQVMNEYFSAPHPARACVGVAALPLGATIEVEAIIALEDSSPQSPG